MRFRAEAIRRIARLAAASPGLRRIVVGMLNRAPRLKRALKQTLARESTIASQRPDSHAGTDTEDALLSRQARRALDDLRRQRARVEADRARPARRS